MSVTPQKPEAPDLESLSIAEIVVKASAAWEELTGVSRDATSWRHADWDLRSMNVEMNDMMRLEPEGTTTYLLLECFLRAWLSQKTFTAAEIMKDYAATTEFLQKAERLFSIVQSDRAVELASRFREAVKKGVQHYKADRPEVMQMIDDADLLPFLRRDALKSLESLKAYQFLDGAPAAGPAQVIEHVYLAWNVNDLLLALRDLPVSGIAVVLLRDPAHPERSYFAFAMRNGERIILFTDKRKPVFPGQDDRFRSRGAGRSFSAREWANHFPYQLVKHHYDEEGDVVFDRESAPVAAGTRLVPLMRIADLDPDQVIWITMMLSLISERFWKQGWTAPELSYTGAMVKEKALLVSDADGARLPVAPGYRPIELERLSVPQVNSEAMHGQIQTWGGGVNAWIEARYRDKVSETLVNVWSESAADTLFLPSLKPQDRHGRTQELIRSSAQGEGIEVFRDPGHLAPWEKHGGYQLQTFSPTEFGTEEELQKDRIWIARHNMAKALQRAADAEFEARKAEVSAWYQARLRENLPALLRMIGAGHAPELVHDRSFGSGKKDGPEMRSMLTFGTLKEMEDRMRWNRDNMLGGPDERGHNPVCVVTEAKATWRAAFNPRTAAGIATLAGCAVTDLPDVLQHWLRERPYVGNSILNRLDPVETDLHDPWAKFPVQVNVYLSKRGYTRAQALAEEAATCP